MSTTFFSSQKNILKRAPSGNDSDGKIEVIQISAPNTVSYGGNLKTSGALIHHNLGYVPVFRYYYEPFNDGVIWPPLTGRTDGNASNPIGAGTGPGILAWAGEGGLYIQLFSSTLSADFTGVFNVYYVIYKDFAIG